MKARCYNPKHKNYADYGGRGIWICDEWKSDFAKFYDWAINNRYSPGLTIDRVDVNSGYTLENCRWVTRAAQANNRRSNINITYNGETHNLRWWADYTGIYYGTLYHRIKKGMDIESVLIK